MWFGKKRKTIINKQFYLRESSHSYYTDVLIFNGVTALLGLSVLATFKRKS